MTRLFNKFKKHYFGPIADTFSQFLEQDFLLRKIRFYLDQLDTGF